MPASSFAVSFQIQLVSGWVTCSSVYFVYKTTSEIGLQIPVYNVITNSCHIERDTDNVAQTMLLLLY